MEPSELIAAHEEHFTHVRVVPARPAVVEPWPAWIDADVVAWHAQRGIDAVWGHQAEAMGHLKDGRHVVIATGTASGKSLAYTAPALSALAQGRLGSALDGHKRPTVLYIAPTKALAFDQLRRLPGADGQPGFDWLSAAAVDGDNSREQRAWARDRANWVLTNPDTLHHSLLPGHERWARFLSGLRFVVVDECHHYRGVFGAHVAHVLRRLRRLCEHYGADPTFVLSSATVSEPAQTARRLIGAEVSAVVDDASPRGERTIALCEPPLLPAREGEQPSRRAATSEAAELLADLVENDTRSLAFVRSRSAAEKLAQLTQQRLRKASSTLDAKVATYRGGYLPEERRELEARLRSGDIVAMAATNALELGIDLSGLDAVLSVGYPGTRAALLQQFGRAGRNGQPSVGILVARDEPIDTFCVHHPEELLDEPPERTVFDPDNPYVLGPHLAAAAQELPLSDSDLELFGPRAADGVEALAAAGMLRRRPKGWYWTSLDRASDLADLRSAGGRAVQIVESSTGRLVGTVDAGSADGQVHQGAVYVHQGETYVVENYDLETAEVRRADVAYSTSAQSTTQVTIASERAARSFGPGTIAFGDVRVTGQVTEYVLREEGSGRVLGRELLDLPERTMPTTAVWWTLSETICRDVIEPQELAGAAHAAEHASIGLLPLFATCDRWDLGGLSTTFHPDTGQLTVFVYDGHPGGAGFAARGFDVAEKWLEFTRQTIASCECFSGCPSCVVSPKCGNGNNPLSKAGAITLLDLLLSSRSAL